MASKPQDKKAPRLYYKADADRDQMRDADVSELDSPDEMEQVEGDKHESLLTGKLRKKGAPSASVAKK